MFKKDNSRVLTLEVVLDALLTLLHNKGIVKRDEVQVEILKGAEPDDDTAEKGTAHRDDKPGN